MSHAQRADRLLIRPASGAPDRRRAARADSSKQRHRNEPAVWSSHAQAASARAWQRPQTEPSTTLTAVGLRSALLDRQVADAAAGEEFSQRAAVRVRPCVVADQPLRLDPVRLEEGERASDEAGDGTGPFVAMEFGVGVACLTGDQARAPTRAAPSRADPDLLGRRQHPRRPERHEERSCRQASVRRSSSPRAATDATNGGQSPAKPLKSGCGRPSTTSPPRSRTRVRGGRVDRAWRYRVVASGTSFESESWQTHSLEGGPDSLSAVHTLSRRVS
jgi:hypothetical protein